jgi:group I intron endonuclease
MTDNNNYTLYWIRTKNHEDIRLDGYVGISNNPNRRFDEHKKKNGKNYILYNALNKHSGDIIFEVVYENLTIERAKDIEKEFRPRQRIGWNIAVGGSVPPSNAGTKRPDHAERMIGDRNPFFGKTHTDETKLILSEKKSGPNNHFYGKKRPDHSKKLKEKKGISYPKFRGHFITPFGNFDSYKEACGSIGITVYSLYEYCIYSNEKIISTTSYGKSNFLKSLNTIENIVGKTYKDIGFGFDYV